MHICSLWLSLVMMCRTASVQSQLCDSDSECESEKCCATGKCAERIAVATNKIQKYKTYCACQADKDCNSWEKCLYSSLFGRFCSRPDESSSVTPQPTWESSTYEPFYNGYNRNRCYWSSDCPESQACEDRQCVDISLSEGVDAWVIIVPIIVFFVVVFCVCTFYSVRQKANLNRPVLEHEIQTGSTAHSNSGSPPSYNLYRQAIQLYNSYDFGRPRIGTRASLAEIQPVHVAAPSSTVVEVGAPPPLYNNDDVPKQPPPSYDEAVRNAELDLD